MIDSKLTVYADYEIIEEIALESDKYPKLTEVFRRMANICLNVSDSKLKDMQTMSSEGVCDPVWQFIQDKDLPTPYALASHFSQDNEDAVYLHDPMAIFLLNITIERAKSLREKYGVLVLCESEMNDNMLQLYCKKSNGLKTQGFAYGTDPNGWNTILDSVPYFRDKPINAAVVSDNHLMDNRNDNIFCGTANLLNLFSNILPTTLSIPFQILIVCPDCSKVPDKARKALEQFSKDINNLRDYTIDVEICLTNKTPVHHRRIFFNYYFITCDKGFSMFKVKPGNIVREDGNDFLIKSYYHDPIYSSGDTDCEDAFSDLNILKKIYTGELQSAPKNRLL